MRLLLFIFILCLGLFSSCSEEKKKSRSQAAADTLTDELLQELEWEESQEQNSLVQDSTYFLEPHE